MLFVITIIQHA